MKEEKTINKEDKCQECGTLLLSGKRETREGGNSELIIECPGCGTVYTD